MRAGQQNSAASSATIATSLHRSTGDLSVEDTAPEGEIGILYPDVKVVQLRALLNGTMILLDSGRRIRASRNRFIARFSNAQLRQGAKRRSPFADSAIATTPALLTLPVMQPVAVRIPSVEIRDTAGNTLVTSIEILSPVNKREPGLSPYCRKRQRL